MNRNTIIGILLIFLILIGSQMLFGPSKEEKEEMARRQDSIRKEQIRKDSILRVEETARQAETDSLTKSKEPDVVIADAETIPEELIDSIESNELFAKYRSFAAASKGNDSLIVIETDLLKIKFAQKGGRIASVELKNYKTYDSLPVVLFTADSSSFGFSFLASDRPITTDSMYFEPEWFNKQSNKVTGDDSIRIAMRLYPNNPDMTVDKSRYIEYLYTIHGNTYRVGFDINFVGMKDIIASNINSFTINWDAHLRQQEKSLKNERMVTTIYYKPLNDKVKYIPERKDDIEDKIGYTKWISFKQQFFSATLIADDYLDVAEIETITREDKNRYLKTLNSEFNIEYNPMVDNSIGMSWYFGPNKYKILRKQKLDLERQIPLGWSFLLHIINRFAVIPVFNWLEGFGWNYGIIILILTILLKTLLFPIAFKMYKSQAKIRVLKPEIDEIAKKFPKKEDSVKKQQATMALYKKAGASPMAGCVPMLLQFPILIAMFRFFPASIELRQQSFLWATDLSSYDSILNLGFEIPFYGDHVSLFTLLMTISTLIYTRMNNQTMASTQQMPGMKTMMYIMPIMFLGFFNSYASALSYYYLLANVITFTQMYLFRRFIDEDKIRAKIEQHKKKPVKKSSFQKRMEDMAKQRGVQPKKKK